MAEEMQQDEGYEQAQNGNPEMTEGENEESLKQQEEDDEDEDDDDRKVFVGGLSWETTPKDLREYFEKYGEVENATLKTDLETKKSRGFGFVVFKQSDCVNKVLNESEHKLHKRKIDPKRANPRPVNKKVFVGKIDPALSEEDIKQYFHAFGPVDKLERPYDKQKEQPRTFCFIEFKKLSGMKKCLEHTGTHKVGTVEVEVKKATPPGGGASAGGAPMRGGPRGRGFGGPGARGGRGGYQGGYPGYGPGYGAPPYSYGAYGGYADGYYGYGDYGYGYGYDGGYQQPYGGYGGYYGSAGYESDWGYPQGGGQSNYGKTQKRGAAHGGYHPYNR